jgi:sigma-70-like protein
MSTLAPDQRAVLELVLRQGRSYGELSELLGIPERDVRARADAGLRALAGEPGAGVDSGRIADWLLGQQPDAEAERTRAAVARSGDARAWAAEAAERLRELGGAAVPEIPSAPDDAPAPRPRPLRNGVPPAAAAPPRPRPASTEAAAPRPRPSEPADGRAAPGPRSSKLGGAVLIGVVVLAVGAVLVFVWTSLGDEEEPASPPAQQQQEQPAEADAPSANQIVLTGSGGSGAQGLMQLVPREDGTVQFQIAAQNVPPNEGREVYAVWFTREGGDARRLGFAQTQVGEDGVLVTGGPQRGDEDRFPRWFATYDKVLVTRERAARATRPGPAVLEGTLPGGAG